MNKTNVSSQEEINDEDVSENKLVKSIESFFLEITLLSKFTVQFFKSLFKAPYEFEELLKQCYIVGYKSLPLVGVTGFIMGLVLTIQSRPTLETFGAESWLPGMVAVSVIREI
jgi:phospholipid/cholesterol/gamma-HCH transport system permease protein